MIGSIQRVALAAVVAALPASARADDPAASALFDEGKALFAAGRYGEARDKLGASYELSPLSGTAGLLAACHERTGQLASAWALYRESAVLAERSGNHERAAIAHKKAEELEPRLARLRIEVPPGGYQVTVTRNGARVPDAALGVLVPVDAGRQVVVATAPGRSRARVAIEIRDGESRTVAIPELHAIPVAAPPIRKPGRSWVGLALLGAGGAAIAAGGAFSVSARGRWDEARSAGCTDSGVCPDRAASDLARSAGRRADLATGFVAGGVAAAAAGLIVIWAGSRPGEEADARVSAAVGPGQVALALEGRF